MTRRDGTSAAPPRRGQYRTALALIAGVALALLVACSRREASARPAARVVSLAPSMTEAMFAIGAGRLLVGRSRFCDFPPEVTALPIVGDVDPDLEAILALTPDLVVGLSALSAPRLADRLGARGIAAWFPETGSLAAIGAMLLGLGERLGRAADAQRVVDRLDARERAIERAVSAEARPRVLMVVSLAPIVAAGPNTFAADVIRVAGGENALANGGPWPTVGFETIVYLDPDVVVDATLVGSDQPTRITPGAPGWGGVAAVRGGRVLSLRDPRVLRAGPRIAEGVEVLARALHPDTPQQ